MALTQLLLLIFQLVLFVGILNLFPLPMSSVSLVFIWFFIAVVLLLDGLAGIQIITVFMHKECIHGQVE